MSDLKHIFTGLGFISPMHGVVFDPVTLATLFGASASTAATIGSIATVAGPVLGVASAIAGVGEAKQQRAEFERQATESRIMASIDAEKVRRDARQQQSKARTSMAEGGALSGTSFGVLDQNAVAQELDALTVAFRGEQQAKSAEFNAGQTNTGYLNVFSSAVEGFNSIDPLNLTKGGKSVRET